MARAMWLPAVLRNAGLTVHEQPGWAARGNEPFTPTGLICHATAGKLDVATDIRVLLTGSETAPPPIAQLFLTRSGEWHVIASGRCNHALTGWGGNLRGLGNTNLLGIEAANDNKTEAWPTVQYESYVRGVAAICRHMGWSTARIAGHKEHQPAAAGKSSTKTDPTFGMDAFRARVTAALAGRPESSTVEGDTDMDYNQAQKLDAVFNLFPTIRLDADGTPDGKGSGQDFDVPLTTWTRKVDKALADLAAKPSASVTLTPEDRAAIIGGVLAGLRPVVREEVAARFADAGQVDEPAP